MIFEVNITVGKMAAGKFAKWLPEHIKKVLTTPGFKQARMYRVGGSEADHLRWIVQFDVDSEQSFRAYEQEQAPVLRADIEREFGPTLVMTHVIHDRVQVLMPAVPEGGLPLSDFPKVQCPFMRQTFKVDVNQWKKLGRQFQLRQPEAYLAVKRVNPGYEWVFEDKDTFAVEKLHGTNVKVLMERGKVIAIQNRLNLVDPLMFGKGQTFILEGLLQASGKDWLPADGEHAGEVIGPKLQGNPYKLAAHEWFPFERTITDLRYRSFEEHERTYENWSAWFKDHLHSRLFTKRATKQGSDEKVFAEGVIFYNLRRKAEKKSWMAKLRRDMFPWFYEGLEIQGFDPAGRDESEDQERFD